MNWRKQNDRLVSSSMRDLGKLERAANNIKCWDVPCTRGLRPHPFPSSPGHLEFPEIRRPESYAHRAPPAFAQFAAYYSAI